ncbi:MAG: U32 family peptidase [Verrucomicrobia bacterium]|jgi:putative protease|nr:U32 family peptidase [Verrucomicrobiota bacterium]|tara:strand:- start:982 stop:3489 length:2508 start_codon:yes stop_codon:yes gene_type:complete
MTELLSPAGNWDCARAAVASGADAIYFGLPKFNARLRADNFSEEDLPELMAYLHKHGVKGFVAMNTLIFTDELETAEKQLRTIAAAGVDALIIQDLGLAKMARLITPEVELHASTQMTITSPEGLAFLETIFPMERAVLSRELSIKEIERFQNSSLLTSHSPLSTPLEVFVHGALCVAYSGQCLTSESLGQRSANRGECAQACRMPYEIVVDGETRDLGEHRYLLSPQDLAAVDLIPDLIKAGVVSFKIEGRLKTPEYVAAVTRVYRKAIDAVAASVPAQAVQTPSRGVSAEEKYELEMTFSRGLTTGWLAGTNHPYLTHGKFGKKRGPFLGTIIEAQNGWIRLDTPPSQQTPPLKAGDGIVFDAGENRDLEQGASIWKIESDRIIFHRTFSGINFDRIRPGVTLYKTADPALESEIRKFWQNAKPKQHKTPLHLTITGQPGEPAVLSSSFDVQRSTFDVRCSSKIHLTEATNRPLSTEVLEKQLSRLGDTPYELASLENNITGDCHLPISALNQLRRDLVEQLEAEQGTQTLVRPSAPATTQALFPLITRHSALATSSLSVLTRTTDQLEAAIAANIQQIYCDFEDPRRYKHAVELARESDSKIILATPRIIKTGETGYLNLIKRANPHGLLLRNLAALHHFKNNDDLIKIGDFSLNAANPLTAKILKESANLERLTISYDLNISQVIDLLEQTPPDWLELTLHQHMPMFHMEHCVFCTFLSSGTTYKDCGRPCEKHVVHLRDRVGQLHRLQADVGCRNTLFNGRAQTGARFFQSLLSTGLRNYRIELLDEDKQSATSTIQAYQDLLSGKLTADQLLTEIQATEKLGVTEGTLA